MHRTEIRELSVTQSVAFCYTCGWQSPVFTGLTATITAMMEANGHLPGLSSILDEQVCDEP